jgi:uncharacterized repeat protein (TIGR01451 family)
MKLVLEARHLFDGSVVAVASKMTHSGLGHSHTEHDASHVTDHGHHQPPHADHGQFTAADALLHPIDFPALAPNPHASEILFVDPRVANWQTLVAGVNSDVQVILIDPNRDGLDQVTAALKGRSDLTAIHFLTYGQAGQLELGNTPITAATLASHAGEVASWGDHLAANADIEFWGCDVGQGASGQAFVDSVHALTGAQIGASTDATGAAQLGGDWTLERTTGVLAVGSPFSAAAMAAYQGVLDVPVPTVAFDPTTVPGDVLLGSTFTETVTFQNTAANAAGYGPFIDVYVPHDAAQSATLTSATYLGSAVTVDALTLSTSIPGHLGVLGALHPLATGSTGAPLFVAAPAGYVAGDTMYVLQLPFGSFTPGQAVAQIQLTFSVNNSTELSSAHGGQTLNISAIGGFQYGADALNDPATDPSIRGTAAMPGQTSAGDGEVVAASQVSLLDVTATTDLHEGETATGPDYPFNYVLTVTPAPVTQGDPIENLTFTFDLPPQVQYTQGTISFTGPGGATGTATFHPGTGGADGPGGTVTVTFTSLGTDSADSPTVIKIPVFVPQFDASGNAILDTAGTPRTISVPTVYTYNGSWTPVSTSLDFASGAETVSGDSNTNPGSVDFVAKALAIQVTDDTPAGNAVPGEVITYSIHFEVSDYYSLDQLNIGDQLGDGLTLLAPGDAGYATPALQLTSGGTTTNYSFGDVANNVAATVNTESVAQSGSSSTWNYTRDDTGSTANPGATSISFGVGALLEAELGGAALASVLQGGAVNGSNGPTQGVITFAARVLDKYTNANNGDSLREKDSVTDTVTTTGTSATTVTVDNAAHTATAVGTVTDGSSVTDTVAPGQLVLTVVAVNGQTTDLTDIEPGDQVTYAMTYTLTTGDYGDLDLTAYLPLPVFSTVDPAANGSDLAFSQDSSGNPFPTTGTYKLVDPLSGEALQGVSANGTANSISFNFGDRDDPTNAPGQQVIVYFSVTASAKPFADGLDLTSQGSSSYTNAAGATQAAAAIQQVPLQEPEVTVKTGVVSVVGDGGSSKGTYTADTSNPNTANPWPTQTTTTPSGAAGAPFEEAGTPAGSLFTGNGTPLTADDLNVSGADGGDLARVVSTVANDGHATAFDVTVQGTLPPGYTAADAQNFAIYNSSGVQIDTGVTAAQYFSTGGAVLASGIAAQDQVYVVYDFRIPTTQTTGETLTAGASIVNWAGVAGGVAAGNGYVSGSGTSAQPLGESAAALTDSASVVVSSPTLTKTVTAGNDTTQLPLGSDNAVVPGETVTYTLVLTLPQGTTTNGGAEVSITDLLPVGMTYVGTDSITYGAGVSHSGAETAVSAGNQLTFNLGTTLTNSNVDTSGTITIVYRATVNSTDTPLGSLTTYTNTATLSYDAGTSVAVKATASVTEHDPVVGETITVKDTVSGTTIATNGQVYSNEDLTYTVTLTNTGTATANDLSDLIDLPAGLTYVPGSLTYLTSGGTGASVVDSNGNALDIGLMTLAVGDTATFTFHATVSQNLPASASLEVQTPADGSSGSYYSMPNTAQGHHYTDNTSDTVKVGAITPVLSIVGESNDTDTTHTPGQTSSQTSVEATVGEIVTMQAYVEIPEGANPTTLDFTMPAGLQYLNDGSATIALVSPLGDLNSDNPALAGVTQYQDVNPAGANYISPSTLSATAGDVATFKPVDALPGSVVTATGNDVSIDLGTLTNNDGSTTGNYVLVQFNALVVNNSTVNHQGAAAQSTSFTVDGATSNAVSVTVEEPTLSITKTATAVDTTTNTVTYQVIVKNTGGASAYNVVIDDPAVANESNLTFVGASGAGSGGAGAAGSTGSDLNYAIGQLGVNGTEIITYTVKVAPGETVQNDAAAATWQSLAGPQTFNGSTAGALGSGTGPRDSDSATNPANTYRVSASTDIGSAQGRIWQDVGNDKSTYSQTDGSSDTPLAGVTVTATITQPDGSVITETTTTGADGTYDFGALPDGSVVISLPGSGSGGLPAGETLVYNPDGSVASNPASVSFTAAGDAHSNVDFAFQTPNTAPVISGWTNTVTYTEGGAPVLLSGTGLVSDTQLDALGDYSNTTLTLQRYGGGLAQPVASDVFEGTGNLTLSGGNVSYSGVTVGTYTETGGVLSITFGAGATATTVNNVLDSIGYVSTDVGTVSTGMQIGATLNDHNTTNAQGTGGALTSARAFVTVDEIPGNVAVVFNEPNNSPAADAAVTVDGSLTVTSSDMLSGATVAITNFQPGEDVLTVGTLPSGVTASFNSNTGVMTLSGTNLSAATVQAALRAVTYYDSSDTPQAAPRNVTISVFDSTTNLTTQAALAVIDVNPANDSPVLNGNPVTLNHATEDAGEPVGAVGTLVSSLTGGGNVTDTDGADAHSGATPGPVGIAITAANTSEGSWWYSTDNGAHWTEFASNGQTAISAANALHLVADGQTRIYFDATPNWNGTVANALTFRGWDQFDGSTNGELSALPAAPTLGDGINTAGSAYSSASQSIALVADAVNDAPVASGSVTMPAQPEDSTTPPADTVAHLFGGNFSDAADQQQTGSNPTGSVANTLAGIAITGNAADPSQGNWQYSTDNGTTWNTIAATGLSDSNALVLSSSAELRFVAAPNFNGVPGQLTTRLIDSSSETLTGTTTGATLAAGDIAVTGVNVSGAHNGGATALSSKTVVLDTSVTAVNDAPVASGSATLPPVNQDDRNPTGGSISGLFGGNFNDSADQQQSAGNPTGSVANPFAGIAITGNAANASQGTWQYSGDGGHTWLDVPSSGLSDHDALVLPASDELRFVPNSTFQGTPGALTARLIDGSNGPLTETNGVDLGTPGGITPYSGATLLLSTQVSATDHPILSTVPELVPDYNAQNDYNKLGDDIEPGDLQAGLDSFGFTPLPQHFPDDGLVPPAGGRGIRSDLYSEPIIPQVGLTGSIGNRFVIEEQHAIIQVPSNLFDDTWPNASLEYDARAPGGGPLPPWLQFDAHNLTFTGTPPLGSRGTVEVEIIARDQFGNQASATFQIMVGQESRDLEAMMARVNLKAPAHRAGDATHGHGHAQSHHAKHPQHPQHAAHAVHAPSTAPDVAMIAPTQAGRSAFSAQLREAGPIGKILQARQIVAAISEMAPVESA